MNKKGLLELIEALAWLALASVAVYIAYLYYHDPEALKALAAKVVG